MATASPTVFVVMAGLFAFLAYCCVYAFRKPFTAGTYEGLMLWGVQYKIVLVMAQVAGYALSKFIGIRVISGIGASSRGYILAMVIGLAALSLLGFALTPHPWNVIWMFINGLPLGMAWGIVFSYLEGRKVTEALAALLCANFIISSGFVKTVGKWLLNTRGVSEQWMPFVAGMIFFPILLLSLWVLEHLPPPSEADKAQRAKRYSMTPAECRSLFMRYSPGLILLIGIYLLLTIIRDVRDNFAVEIWAELGMAGQSAILTTAELPIAVLSLVAVGALMFVQNNFYAFWIQHLLTLFGAILIIGSTMLFQYHFISPVTWMILSGFGIFLPYIIFNGVLFDRFMAAYKEKGNVGFLMYSADSIGYLGSVVVLLWRNFSASNMSWLVFYTQLCYFGAGLSVVFTVSSYFYFKSKSRSGKY